MTDNEKVAKLKIMLGEPDADTQTLTVYINLAEKAILNKLYPFGIPENSVMPTRYEVDQLRLAVAYYSRRGAEGETYHGENGINRTYASANDEELLRHIVPYAKLM